ncbi:non-ribosomal peptide synthetase [Butyrivibrio sp. NC3005]|uniref:non-ribosomal peptide synthetase n=1 Tax=Butyrivibrio sp. NC3005 TaxID=1280685 RepID=UPI000424BB63|nr:non-ribosomal peptide synthetase [Butyrivibrio sp. NC3005]
MNIDEIWMQFEERIRKAVKNDEFMPDTKLTEVGIDSITLMKFASFLRRKGLKVNYGELIKNPTLKDWKELVWMKFEALSGNEANSQRSNDAIENSDNGSSKTKLSEIEFDLTDVQYAYWAGRQDDQELGGVGCHAYFEFDGIGDDDSRLRNAWYKVQDAHPMLRAVFTEEGKQKIYAKRKYLEPVFHDFRSFTRQEADEKLLEIRNRLSHEKLKVENGENTHLEAAFMKNGERRIFLDVDLLVADVASVHLIIMELTKAYLGQKLYNYEIDCFKKYLDKRKNDAETLTEDVAYWKEKITDFPEEPISLPLKSRPEEVKKNHFVRISKSFSCDVWSVLKERAAKYELSPAMFLLTAYANVLSRYSGQNKFLINIPLFNRFDDDERTEKIVADFTNLLLLNTENSGNKSFLDYAVEIKDNFSKDVSHSSYSGVNVERDLSKHNKAVQNMAPVVFACNIDFPFETKESRDVLGKLSYMISQTPQVWLDFQSFTDMGKLILCWDYVEDLFSKEVIEEMFSALTEEIEELYNSDDWNKVFDVLPKNQKERHEKEEDILPMDIENVSLLSGFVQNAVKIPDSPALISVKDSRITTYKELADIAGKVGSYLKSHGIKKGDYVAVTLPRGYRQIYAIMGILYAGAVYVPVGINQPADRRIKIYEQIGITAVISDLQTKETIELAIDNVIDLDKAMECSTNIAPEILPDNSAYVIMTSGSTGMPKGVEIVHKAAMNTITYLCKRYNFKAFDKMLMVSAIEFDLSVFDIFGMLYSQGAIVIPEEDSFKNPEVWLELIDKYGINRWNSVPILFDMLITYAEGKKKKVYFDTVFMSGDWIPVNLPGRFYDIAGKNSLVVAMGGATEASIWSNYQEVPRVIPDNWQSIPYGRPLKNQLYRVIDDYGNICPDYVAGQLCIGGAGVAAGYKGDLNLTQKKFFKEENGIRWYRTGDNGRTWSDGTIEFLGRRDNQVKVKGHRIELGEIENAIKQYQGVRGSAVLAIPYENKGNRIVAFIQSEKIKTSYNKEYEISKKVYSLEEINSGKEKLKQIGILSDDFIQRAVNNNKGVNSNIIKYWKKLNVKNVGVSIEDTRANKDITKMYESVLDILPDIFSGKIDPIEYFYDLASDYRPDQLLEKHQETEKAHELILEMVKSYPVKKGLKILEVGGRNPKFTGSVLQKMSGRIEKYTYLDNTEFFRAGYEDIVKGFSEFEYSVNGLDAISVDGTMFDVVIIPESIHRQKDIDKTVKLFGNITVSGGIVIGCEPSSNLKMINTIPAILEDGFAEYDLDKRGGSIIPGREYLEKTFNENGYELLHLSDKAEEMATYSIIYVFRQQYMQNIDIDGLKDYLIKEIPSYMIPFKYYKMQDFPLNKNGKIDRKKLLQIFKEERNSENNQEEKDGIRSKTENFVAEILKNILGVENIGRNDNFFSLGGDSLSATKFIAIMRDQYGLQLSIKNIFENPVIKDLSSFIDGHKDNIKAGGDEKFIVHREDWNNPFPLTQVQFAYWIGRKGAFSLGNVATHCYYEYECNHIDIPLFQRIWNEMIKYHGMLRTVIDNNGMQTMLDKVPFYTMKTIHAEGVSEDTKKGILESVRNKMEALVTETDKWPLFDIRVTVLSEEKTIIHISFDNIILDGFSMFHILQEMAERYKEALSGQSIQRKIPEVSFRDYVIDLERKRASRRYEIDKEYWTNRLSCFCKAPVFPLIKNEDEIKVPKFVRRQYKLSQDCWNKLKDAAKEMEITPSAFIITAYADALRTESINKSFSINLTQFGNDISHKDADKIVGDFTRLSLLEMKNIQESSFNERCKKAAKQISDDLEHSLYSAVEYERELRKRDNNPVNSIMPVVFTSGIGVSDLSQEKSLGKLVYNISQTPQVWIDHQVFEQDKGLTLNWDCVDELLSAQLLDRMFEYYISHLIDMIENKEKRAEIQVVEDDEQNELSLQNSIPTEVSFPDNESTEVKKEPEIAIVKGGRYISKVAQIWESVLGEKVVDMDSTFFELGGDSLGIVKMINAISQEYDTELSIIDVINNNSIRKIAGLLENVVQEGII